MSSKFKYFKNQVKDKADETVSNEKEKYQKQTKKLDQNLKLDKLDQKAQDAKKQAKLNQLVFFPYGFKTQIAKGGVWRGFLKLLQFWAEFILIFMTVMFCATVLLPSVATELGHGAGLPVHSSTIDQFMFMYLPSSFVAIAMAVCDFLFLRWIWQLLDKAIGHLRFNSWVKNGFDAKKFK